MKFLLSFLLLTSVAYAQKAQVLLIDESIDGKELEKNFKVQKGSTHVSSLPPKEIRDEVLKGVKQTEKWDELQKDIFYMELESKSVKELKKKYSAFSEKELQFLKDKR